ncbi:MAG: hypothetical protein FJW36_05035 [Acidobacteria bacterium]|nr:hypothetical protein [Acidobacteriota bacterium]
MRPLVFLFILRCSAQDSVDEIMSKVAANLEKGSELRKQYVYTQKIHTRLLRTNSKLAREERREYAMTPGHDRIEKKLVKFEGQYEKGKKLIPYDDPGFRHKDLDIDGDLIEDLAEDLIGEEKSKDGIDMNLFPFLPKDLPDYRFKLLKTEEYRGRKVHRVEFAGKEKDKPWVGEALIDAEDLHPVSIQTKLNFKMPFVVKAMLGTDLRQTGFSLTYVRVEPGVWFPATYGTEMRLDVLFGYKRVIAMSMEASEFKKVGAESTISFEKFD